jgi:hypothetical protein
MARPRRTLVLTMLPDEWDRLVEQGKAAERDPYQQARYLIVRGLDERDRRTGEALDQATADVA